MVTTAKQLIANRENAKKGGVKTEKGKSISRFNAVKHGIFTNVIIADMEESDVLNQLRGRVFDEFKPKGVIEETLVDRIVVCIWRLRRCAIADKAVTEQEYQEAKYNIFADSEEEREFDSKTWVLTHGPTELLLRYETTIERQLYRVMRELRDLQKMRFDSEQKFLPQP
ncbi:hypothetical protein ACFLXX_04240 [Chloroflexota bacterium]